MSLINDMLQDLDRDDVRAAPALPAGLAATAPVAPASPRRYILPGLAVLAVAYALLVEANLFGLMPAKKAPAAIPQPVAFNSKWLNHNQKAESPPADAPAAAVALDTAPAVVVADVVAPVADTHPTASLDQVAAERPTVTTAAAAPNPAAVERLLDAASHALAANRLTTPVGDNAYELFKSVLVIDAHNEAAQAGIESIRQRYLMWLDQAVAEGRDAAVRVYVQKARNVGVETTVLAAYEEPRGAATAVPAPAEIPAVATLPQATITPAAAPDDGTMAERLRSAGLRVEAEALRLIAQTRATPQTSVALADLYGERRSLGEMRRLADLLAQKSESAYAYVAAQLWLLDGQERRAIEALSSVEFEGLAERQRLRLLAGLHQKAGEYAAAMALYSDLVSASPESAADWLGLAVSADRNRVPDTALDAYKKVLLLRHPDQRVMQFARQRQQDLSLAAMTDR